VRGQGTLALGDPEYGDRELAPLPETRAEAAAVGDVVLLGADATEARLVEALAARERWRSVHLACHAAIDPERLDRSSLAVTVGAGGDGHLTAQEVFRLRVPADLVVLSACETGRGKAYGAEGVVGFTRAFLHAGAPRVIVSLWRVEDRATRVLMEEFYAAWKTGGVSTAEALRRAQAKVASTEGWEHPRYWAAWQLWGLPD